jgi:DNA-directed RNA polymerase specialized sigma24 family protein
MKDWELTEESFNFFLSWLSSDRDAAGKKYEDIRRRLIVVLHARGCARAEEAADESINRFIRRLPELGKTYKGDPVPYLCAIARNVHLEISRKELDSLPDNFDELFPEDGDTDKLKELIHGCLETCLNEFDSDNRQLLLDYYKEDRQAKINFRKQLAGTMGIGANALRLKLHRLRVKLQSCLNHCLADEGGS